MRSGFVALAALVVLAAFVAGGRLCSAPKLQDRPDAVTGQLGSEQDSPVVYLPECDDGLPVVWLVFADPRLEALVPEKAAPGDRVTARGTLAQGGPFKYLVVTSVEKTE